MDNDEKVREILEQESVPEEISPENMKAMLDEKAPAKKRKKISAAGRIAAIAASIALIVGTAVGTAGVVRNFGQFGKFSNDGEVTIDLDETPSENEPAAAPKVSTGESYMAGAENYKQIYNLLKTQNEKNKKYRDAGDTYGAIDGAMFNNAETAEESETYAAAAEDFGYDEAKGEIPVEEEAAPADTAPPDADITQSANGVEETEFSETYDQEEGVLEADIVKTDGERIFYLANSQTYDMATYEEKGGIFTSCCLNIAAVDDGNFTDSTTISVSPEVNIEGIGWQTNIYVNDMYLYNDMIAIIGGVNSYRDSYTINEAEGVEYDYRKEEFICENNDSCFVSFYTNEDVPQLIGTYWQDGNYNDVRISPEGYMFLVSSYNSCSYDDIRDEDDIEAYIPKCGVDEGVRCMPPN